MVKERNLWLVGALSLFTLGLYNFYLIYEWSREINATLGKEKYSPGIVLLISILTLGVGLSVYECVFAFDHAAAAATAGRDLRTKGLAAAVVALNATAVILNLTGYGFVVGLPAGVAATVLLQREFNAVALPRAGVARA